MKEIILAGGLEMADDTTLAIFGPAVQKSATNKERRARYIDALNETDIDLLLSAQDKLADVINKMTRNDLSEMGARLSEDQLTSLMDEWLDQNDIRQLLEGRYAMIRAAIFDHITALNADQGIADPQFAAGEAPVSALGKKFSRRGGNPKFDVDEAKLAKELGDDADEVFRTVVIPEHVVPEKVSRMLDQDALMKLAAQRPEVLEKVRRCVVLRGHTPQSFRVTEL